MDDALQITIKTSKLRKLASDHEAAAAAVHLKYVRDNEPGIVRLKKGDKFVYQSGKKTVTDEATLARIKSLVIPPAWTNVWICSIADGHLQATGLDTKNRKQYRYHPLWNKLRNHTKFSHLYDFGNALPAIRRRLQKDLATRGLPLNKVLATIVSLMQCTCIRIGSNEYEKLYGSFGLSTLKDRHVKEEGNQLKFVFKGKKGVYHNITLRSKRLARIVKQCKDIPGQELFQYYDDAGKRHPVDSGMVNSYIDSLCDGHFTSKDFRTWEGTLHAIEAFRDLGCSGTAAETKRKIVDALDAVAGRLGNTRTVCKKYYVHPVVVDHYSNNTISKYFDSAANLKCNDTDVELSTEEQVLMKMLGDTKKAIM